MDYSATGNRSGVEKRPAWDDFFRRLYVRNDLLGRQLCASAQTGHSCGGSHQLQDIAPVDAFAILAGFRRKLVVAEMLELRSARNFFKALPKPPVALSGKLRAYRSQIDRIFSGLSPGSSFHFHHR